MNRYGWLQLAVFLGLLLPVTRPMGLYLFRVLDPAGKTFLDPVLKPVERAFYRGMGIDPGVEHDWKRYTLSVLVFSMVGMLFTYAILRLQRWLPLNPQRLGPLPGDLAFNTSMSFTTNTNWQSYGGESTMAYF
jgi:potassium-transporting ATPase potassium-binding subunit